MAHQLEALLKHHKVYEGYIRSCVRDTYNKDMLFFNMGGNY